jgi:hypothetical protein
MVEGTGVPRKNNRPAAVEKTEGAIKNGQCRDTSNTGHTRHKTKSNQGIIKQGQWKCRIK